MAWWLEGDVLRVQTEGVRVTPDAEQIFRSIIEGEQVWPDVPPGKSGLPANIEFSEYPASVHAVIDKFGSSAIPSVSLKLVTQDGAQKRLTDKAFVAGHVVVDGQWFPLDPASAEELGNWLADHNLVPGQEVPSFGSLIRLKAEAAASDFVEDNTSEDRVSVEPYLPSSDSTPQNLEAELYPYQLDGWRWLRFLIGERIGGLLADEMGLGKTLQVIAAINDYSGGNALSPALVVAPGSLLENWRREFERFAPRLKVLKHNGAMRSGRPAFLREFDVVITSYDTVIRDLSLLKMIEWAVIVADEAQQIKNPQAIRSDSIKQLPKAVGLAMTGTPVENRVSDVLSIMEFAVPDYLPSASDFSRRYPEEIDAAKAIEPLLSPLMLRRRVAEVAKDLPERIDIPQIVEMSDGEAKSYEAHRVAIQEEYGPQASLVALTTLRQFCAHPALLDDAAGNLSDFSKFQRLMEILEEIFAANEKAIVFTSYTKMADMIAEEIRKAGGFSGTLDGRLPIDDRQPLIDRFAEYDGYGALVLNPKAGGAGLNITAANHVIHYNLEWNPALEDQASARAHRRGQVRPVTVHRLICAGTVEEVVDERVSRKRVIADVAVVGVTGKEEEYQDILSALARSPIK